MNEGKGLMWDLAIAYKNGAINKEMLHVICVYNDWHYIFDDDLGVIIGPNIIHKQTQEEIPYKELFERYQNYCLSESDWHNIIKVIEKGERLKLLERLILNER